MSLDGSWMCQGSNKCHMTDVVQTRHLPACILKWSQLETWPPSLLVLPVLYTYIYIYRYTSSLDCCHNLTLCLHCRCVSLARPRASPSLVSGAPSASSASALSAANAWGRWGNEQEVWPSMCTAFTQLAVTLFPCFVVQICNKNDC